MAVAMHVADHGDCPATLAAQTARKKALSAPAPRRAPGREGDERGGMIPR